MSNLADCATVLRYTHGDGQREINVYKLHDAAERLLEALKNYRQACHTCVFEAVCFSCKAAEEAMRFADL